MNLDKKTISILRYIYNHRGIAYGDLKKHFENESMFDFISVLFAEKTIFAQGHAKSGQLGWYLSDKSKIFCTSLGKKYVEDYFEKRNGKIVEWVRYSITTAIALAAFIKSFFF